MNPQIKKIIRKISKKAKLVNSNESDNGNTSLPKRKFSFFRHSISNNKLECNSINQNDYRNSVDLADLQRKKDRKLSPLLQGNCSINILNENCSEVVNNISQLSPDDKTCKISQEPLTNDPKDLSESSHVGIPLQMPDDKILMDDDSEICSTDDKKSINYLWSSSQVPDRHVNNELVISSCSIDLFKFILRKLFNYPNNFYVCLSYIITVFLLISTLYVAYQVDRLETNLVRLIEKNHNNWEKNQKGSPDWRKNRELLISQIERLSQLMKTVQEKLS